MTSTVITRATACPGVPTSNHTAAVSAAAARAYQNSQPEARSARRWAREEEFCASSTSLLMPASVVSSPRAVTSTRKPESVATVPATTASPSLRRTVADSPVIIDSSMLAEPWTTRPSAGRDAPGRTTTTSPRRSSSGLIFSTSAPTTRSASSGSSAARESNAELVCDSERISIQWPSSMITISSASSHQYSSSGLIQPKVAAQEERKATVIASATNSIMPGRRCVISAHAPSRKGRPPQKYMTLPRIGETHRPAPLTS